MKTITIAILALIATTAQANQSNIDLSANIQGGCKFTLSDDKVNFNSADYPVNKDTLGGRYKNITIKAICSKGVTYSFISNDLIGTSKVAYLMMNTKEDGSSLNYKITTSTGTSLHYYPQSEKSSGEERKYELQISINSSPHNPNAGDYAGSFELIFTY